MSLYAVGSPASEPAAEGKRARRCLFWGFFLKFYGCLLPDQIANDSGLWDPSLPVHFNTENQHELIKLITIFISNGTGSISYHSTVSESKFYLNKEGETSWAFFFLIKEKYT